MKDKLLLVVVCVLAFAGYMIYSHFHSPEYLAQEQVRAQLIDPESAQFRNVKERRNEAVCGEVNSKNRLGGYTGFVNFGVRRGDIVIENPELSINPLEKIIGSDAYSKICVLGN